MASRSFQALFLQSRDRLTATRRGNRRLLLALIFLQLAVLFPATQAHRQTASQRGTAAALETVLGGLETMGSRLRGAHGQALDGLDPLLESLVDELQTDFTRLGEALDEVQQGASESAETPDEDSEVSAGPDTEPNPWSTFLQAPTIREASNRYSLLTALEPVVEEHLLRSQFAELNEAWTREIRGPMEAEVESLAGEISNLRTRRQEPAASWDDLVAALGGLRRALDDIEFRPPERAYWWASPEEEPELTIGLDLMAREEVLHPRALDELRAMVERVMEQRGVLEKALRSDQRRLVSRSGGASGDQLFGLDLWGISQIWPLLLGLCLALRTVWLSAALRELGVLTSLMVEHGSPTTLRGWLLAEMRRGFDVLTTGPSTARACLVRSLGGLVAGWLWIVGASIHVHGSVLDPKLHAAALAGALIFLLAVFHRLYVNGQVIDLLGSESIEPDLEPPPEIEGNVTPEADQEVVGGQDLLR